MATDNAVVYEENAVPGGNRTVLAVIGASSLALLIALVFGLAWLGWPAAIILLVGSVLLLSLQRYSGIRVTQQELSVGRDTVALASLDAGFGVRRGENELPDEIRASLEVGLSSKRGDLNILGGAWGRPKTGSTWLVVQERTGQRHVISSRNADAMTAALNPLLDAASR